VSHPRRTRASATARPSASRGIPSAEYLGLLFAYLGPPEKKPALPRYDVFEDMPADEEIVADGSNIGLAGDTTPCNWVQTHENVMDPYHVSCCTPPTAAISSSRSWVSCRR